MKFVRGHPLVVLFLLVFALTWVVWVPRAAGVPTGTVGRCMDLGSCDSSVDGRSPDRGPSSAPAAGRRLLRWRVPWQWYGVVILGPAMFSLITAAIYALLGGSWSAAFRDPSRHRWSCCHCSC
jgi:hypothetical protein